MNEKLLAGQENLLFPDETWDVDIAIQLIMAPCFVSVVASSFLSIPSSHDQDSVTFLYFNKCFKKAKRE